jgi:hypothetical protein
MTLVAGERYVCSCDSFCNKYFETVAGSEREAELDAAGQAQVCDPWKLRYWKSLSETRRSAKPHQE